MQTAPIDSSVLSAARLGLAHRRIEGACGGRRLPARLAGRQRLGEIAPMPGFGQARASLFEASAPERL